MNRARIAARLAAEANAEFSKAVAAGEYVDERERQGYVQTWVEEGLSDAEYDDACERWAFGSADPRGHTELAELRLLGHWRRCVPRDHRMTAQHTPAPWRICGPYNTLKDEIGADGRAVCTVWTRRMPDGLQERQDGPQPSPEGEANARLIVAAPVGLACAESTYLALLKLPHALWRAHNQRVFCELRDYIALATGRSAEDVQNEFEARAA